MDFTLRLREKGHDPEPRPAKASAQTGTRGSAEALVRLGVLRPEQESGPEDNLPRERQADD